MKKLLGLIMLFALLMVSCTEKTKNNSADKQMADQTAVQQEEMHRQVGMPAIKNFQERKLAKLIIEERDKESLICHAYLVNQMDGTVGQYLGKCLGYGLPYSVQFTNPEKIVVNRHYSGGGLYGTLPQADPNGLFMPGALSATWLMLLDEKGEAHPAYFEPLLIVSPIKLH